MLEKGHSQSGTLYELHLKRISLSFSQVERETEKRNEGGRKRKKKKKEKRRRGREGSEQEGKEGGRDQNGSTTFRFG